MYYALHACHARQAVIPETLLDGEDSFPDAGTLFACISGAFYPREPKVSAMVLTALARCRVCVCVCVCIWPH